MALGTCLLAGPARAQGKIATVDIERVFTNYYVTKQASAAISDRAAELDKELKGFLDDLDKANDEYKKLLDAANDQAVSSEERDKRKQAAEAKLKDIKDLNDTVVQFRRVQQTKLDEQRRRRRDQIHTAIQKALEAKAKAAGYVLVLDTSAKGANNVLELVSMALNRVDPSDEQARTPPVVLYASSDNDITDALIKQLNAAAPVETPSPAEKKDSTK